MNPSNRTIQQILIEILLHLVKLMLRLRVKHCFVPHCLNENLIGRCVVPAAVKSNDIRLVYCYYIFYRLRDLGIREKQRVSALLHDLLW